MAHSDSPDASETEVQLDMFGPPQARSAPEPESVRAELDPILAMARAAGLAGDEAQLLLELETELTRSAA